MMRINTYILFTIVALILTNEVNAQDLKVKSFEKDLTDVTARSNAVRDGNGDICALIKVSLPVANCKFDGNIVGEPEFRVSEYWIYITQGSKNLQIRCPGCKTLFVNLRTSEGEVRVESAVTYRLEVSGYDVGGGSDAAAPVAMASKADDILPDWWNQSNPEMFVGISPPSLDGKTAKIAALINAIMLYAQSSKNSYIESKINIDKEIFYKSPAIYSYIDNTEHTEDDYIVEKLETNYKWESNLIANNFSCDILQEYYNSRGEYFILCRVAPANNSTNTLTVVWKYFQEHIQAYAELKLNIGRSVIRGNHLFNLEWNHASAQMSVVTNKHPFSSISNFSYPNTAPKDATPSPIAHSAQESLGMVQNRLIFGLPCLTDSLIIYNYEKISNQINEKVTDCSHAIIAGLGSNSPRKRSLLNIRNQMVEYSIEDIIPYKIQQGEAFDFYIDRGTESSLGAEYLFDGMYEDGVYEDKFHSEMPNVENIPLEIKKTHAFCIAILSLAHYSFNIAAYKKTKGEATNYYSKSTMTEDSYYSKSLSHEPLPIEIWPLWFLDASKRKRYSHKSKRNEWEENVRKINNMVRLPIVD